MFKNINCYDNGWYNNWSPQFYCSAEIVLPNYQTNTFIIIIQIHFHWHILLWKCHDFCYEMKHTLQSKKAENWKEGWRLKARKTQNVIVTHPYKTNDAHSQFIHSLMVLTTKEWNLHKQHKGGLYKYCMYVD